MAQLFEGQEPLSGAVSIEEAIARTLKYNLDFRLRLMDEIIAKGQLDLASMELLPRVAANVNQSLRNSRDATYNAARTTTSSTADKAPRVADLHVSWNVLDFGIGYLQARQQAEQINMAAERRRQVVHNIVQQVRGAYWRAAAAERVLGEFDPMLDRVRVALQFSDQQAEENLNKMDTLIYQRQLIETVRQLETLRRDMQEAKIELALLMNVHPNMPFSIAGVSMLNQPQPRMYEVQIPTEELERTAISNRAELRMEAYQLRVAQLEGRIGLLQSIPGANISFGVNRTSDQYKVNRTWYDGSLFLTWNIINVFSGPKRISLAEKREQLSQQRSLALSMAVIAQINVSQLNLTQSRRDFELADRLYDIERRILEELRNSRTIEAASESELVQGEVREVLARLERDLAYASHQSAFGQVVAALGADPLIFTAKNESVADVAVAVAETLERWENSDFLFNN